MTYVVYVLYPLIGWVLFSTMRLAYAIPATLVLGYLLLPAAFAINFPILPSLEKNTMPAFVVLALVLLFHRPPKPHDRIAQAREARSVPVDHVLAGWIPKQAWVKALLFMMVFAPLATFMFNRDPLVRGSAFSPGIGVYDTIHGVQVIAVSLLALLIGRRYLAGDQGHRGILLALAAGGLVLSVMAILEIRLSPQFHNIVYGYFPHSFANHIRDGLFGSFRPVVFMPHSLVLSLFLCMSALSIMAYMRAIDGDKRVLYFLAALYMVAVIFLSKNFGMVLVALVLIPVVMLGTARIQMLCAALICGLVLTYPLLRIAGANPLMPVVQLVQPVNEGRAASLKHRLDTEIAHLEHGFEKPLFGWGGFGRAEARFEIGIKVSARDGNWLITFGERGVVGFTGLYGLLCLPTIILFLRQRRFALTYATVGLCVVMSANMLDLLPNDGLTPITMLIAGALLGRVELGDKAAALQEAPIAPQTAVPEVRSARPGVGRPPPDAPLAARLRRRPDPSHQETAPAPEPDIAKKPAYSRFEPRHVRRSRIT